MTVTMEAALATIREIEEACGPLSNVSVTMADDARVVRVVSALNSLRDWAVETEGQREARALAGLNNPSRAYLGFESWEQRTEFQQAGGAHSDSMPESHLGYLLAEMAGGRFECEWEPSLETYHNYAQADRDYCEAVAIHTAHRTGGME